MVGEIEPEWVASQLTMCVRGRPMLVLIGNLSELCVELTRVVDEYLLNAPRLSPCRSQMQGNRLRFEMHRSQCWLNMKLCKIERLRASSNGNQKETFDSQEKGTTNDQGEKQKASFQVFKEKRRLVAEVLRKRTGHTHDES